MPTAGVVTPDLSRAYLGDAKFGGANLIDANFSGADLSESENFSTSGSGCNLH